MLRTTIMVWLAFTTACTVGAESRGNAGGAWDNLTPVPNPNDEAPAQPLRANPFAVAMTRDGRRALVTLRGNELEPDNRVVVIDVPDRHVAGEVEVGSRPHAIGLRPQGDFAVVLCQFSRYAAVIDVDRGELAGRLELGYYASDLVFSADGSKMYVSNRATDSVDEFSIGVVGDRLQATAGRTLPAGTNPGSLALSPDEAQLYVADAGGLGVRVIDPASMAELGFIPMNSPVQDLATMGPWIAVATLNDTSGLPCEDDGDFIGTEGDGIFPLVTDRTCARGFADIQNEIAFIDPNAPIEDAVVVRYTSDTAEASEADRDGDYDPELMRVHGALPQTIAVAGDTRAYVVMSASNELVEMSIDGGSPPDMTMSRWWPTGFAPQGGAVDADATVAVVANQLGETASIIDLASGDTTTLPIGRTSPAFPATQAELGELFFHTSLYSTDGDQSCTHCHPDAGNDGKTWGVDIVRAFGRRSTLPLRNLAETKPLLVEGVFDEHDFNLEMEGISYRPDFHDSSYTLQVQRRDAFYRQTSYELLGRAVGFDEMKEAIGAFLMVEPRLLPSPFPADTPQVERGRALFFRPDVGCGACHPDPSFASPQLFAGVTTLGRYDLPRRDLDPNVSIKYIENARDGFFNANSLRGLWDRPGALFHDGRARTIRETLLTPGHRCLKDGERAFNEFNGQVDTNGGISQLTCDQVDDLVAFLRTIN